MSFHGLLLAINTPTRERNCLDHVVLKTKLPAMTFYLQTTLTDHTAVLFRLKQKEVCKLTLTNNYVESTGIVLVQNVQEWTLIIYSLKKT